MKTLLLALLFFTLIAGIVINKAMAPFKKSQEAYSKTKIPQGFTVLELFTSQGCSSCPPADELLGKYASQDNDKIIPLAFHVDYWDRLGWKDSFSTSSYTQRQKEYAQMFSNSSVYTPQVVINGGTEMIGSDKSKIDVAISKALAETPAAIIAIGSNEITGNKISIQYNVTGDIAKANIFALLIQDKAVTKIKAGENDGATLTSYNVVRDIVFTEAKKSGSFALQIPLNVDTKNLGIVLLIQNKVTLKIIGAVKKLLL
jgi:hypothetical protein